MIEKYYHPFTDIYDRLGKWKQFHKDIHTKLRLFYLECRQNLELLNILDFNQDNEEILTTDEDFKSVAGQLETEVLEMIFLEGKKNNKFYEVLRKKIDIEEEEDNEKQKKKKSLIQACVYLYVKIAILKKIAGIERKGKALKKIYFRARLNNIRYNYLSIVKALCQHKEIKEITTA